MSQISFYKVALPELVKTIQSWGEPYDQARTVARYIWRQAYTASVADFSEMTEIPPWLQQQLTGAFALTHPVKIAQSTSPDGTTRKDLLALEDGSQIETVLLRYRDRYTVCVSTQVGCACDCSFCATGRMGFVRQLHCGEIVAQVLHFQRWLAPQDKTVSNVVFMGMGEPLLNREQTLESVQRLTDPRGLSLAPGRITLSTAGIAPGIEYLADVHHRWPIKLAISLHAATDDLRTRLMPINETYPLGRLYEAVRVYTEKTRRRVLFEWIMIAGVNDTREQALALVTWLQDLPSHVNLIRLNPTSAYDGAPSTGGTTEAFSAILDQRQIPHTMRQRRGAGIDAGCGQLYARRRP
ncbi:MAG: 23S rRNA (adenine(2503)-C(2))-methyltransferase RlmN [Anaerolineae bacterium]|nr:23S rRNA (adenine(2503)-C(2))-methyltransferase RlmN [Anaerolineae bacterium]